MQTKEIIGAAVYKLTKEYKAAHPEIEWNDISGMRHIIVHDYYMVSKSVVLAVIKKDLPILQNKIAALYENY